MTRKHFISLAAALKSTRPDDTNSVQFQTWKRTVKEVIGAVAQYNSNFNRQRFERACGGLGEESN